jgi:endoglucanase
VTLGTTPQSFSWTFSSIVADEHGEVTFQMGGGGSATICVDDVSLTGGEPNGGYHPDTGPPVRVNQVGYLPRGPKQATVVTDATDPLAWRLRDAKGKVVASGRTVPHGPDTNSGDAVQLADFSRYSRSGDGYTLAVDLPAGEQVSYPFRIADDLYGGLRHDALEFFYQQRSGIAIDAKFVGPTYARAAGHVDVAPNQGDGNVTCLGGCDYSLDVRGGWYDAGDQGKYVVNGGIATWTLLDAFERAPGAFRDGAQAIPENHNRVPDILDESRWELNFLLAMQVPDGQPLAGMAHQKVHDDNWTGLPTMPWLDAQPRHLHPPSTTATLNLAATAAQCARIWRAYDRAFAGRCLTAAEKAWAAASAHPDLLPPGSDGNGGGAYDDSRATDEFFWAAAELYTTTGKAVYRDALTSSPFFGHAFDGDGFTWQSVAGLGAITLATVQNRLPAPALRTVRDDIVATAGADLAALRGQGYPNPYQPTTGGYSWGSNSFTLNDAITLGVAYDLTHQAKYRDGVLSSLDYVLGRNALNVSYVTDYGTVTTQNEHHRFWANELDPTLPHPPAGTMAGGPNSGLQDPVAAAKLQGCAPAKCYIDDIGSYSTNEEAINWNAPLVWASAFADEQARPCD